MTKKKPYEELSDLEKLHKQWHKLSGLHTREEWSAAIVRAATAAEIAANFAIRKEFEARSTFEENFVNSLLRWANGLNGKLKQLLIPLNIGNEQKDAAMRELEKVADKINKKRNAVVHQGEFCNEDEAKAVIEQSYEFITSLVQLYDADFKLKDKTPSN
jgi:hypothetical protein